MHVVRARGVFVRAAPSGVCEGGYAHTLPQHRLSISSPRVFSIEAEGMGFASPAATKAPPPARATLTARSTRL